MTRPLATIFALSCATLLTGRLGYAQIANGSYRIVNKNSAKCVDAAGSGTANGTSVQQLACNGGNSQVWQLVATDSGYYKVLPQNSATQGWDVSGGTSATGDGVKIQLWSYGGATNQQFSPIAETGGTYHWLARHSGKCFDVANASTADGLQLQQWTCNGTAAESFQIVSTSSATPTATTPSGSNLAAGKPITASSVQQTFVAANANDGNVTTYWEGAANTYPNTLTVSLGTNANITSVVVKLNPATTWARRTQTIQVLGHAAGVSTFSSLVASTTYTFDPATGNSVTIPVTATVSDVQLSFTANSGATGGQAAEFQVFGTAGAATATATATATRTPTATTRATATPTAGATATATTTRPTATSTQAAVGATTLFTSYEAEAGTLGGGATIVALTAPPADQYSSPTLEASGHAYVQLSGTGQYVEWVNNTGQAITFINVRASVPDAPGGGGITTTLDLLVDGTFRQALTLSSKQTWLYENSSTYNGNDQNPSTGAARVYYDDAHTFITGAAIAPGSRIRLQKNAANSAAFYYIDVVDLETPPAPRAQPANSLSIASYGAVANNTGVDNSTAIQNCINDAQAQGKSVWIPQGTFYVRTQGGLNANGITIEGAGMWYSTIYRNMPLPNPNPLGAIFNLTSCTVRHFALDANAPSRATQDGCGGAMDTTGTNWVADSIWTQHTMSGFWASGTGGKVQNCRLTSIWADGINLNNVALNGTVGNNLTATNNFVRGTGDDAIAINSVNFNGSTTYTPMSNVTLTNNTSIAPWGGKGIGIYGGGGHVVKNNYMSDNARYVGLGVMKFGVNGSDLTSATVSGNMVVRGGANAFLEQQPAMHIGNASDGQRVGIVSNAVVSNNTIRDSMYDSIDFSTSTGTQLQTNTIINPGRDGIAIGPPHFEATSGDATITGNTVTGVKAGRSAFISYSTAFTANVSGNSWQGGGTATPTPTPSTQGPFGGTNRTIANGSTIQAEDYDVGGQSVAYNDTTAGNSGGAYRTDNVDIEACGDTGGGFNVGWLVDGEWLEYTVNATAGTYTITARVASAGAAVGDIQVSLDGVVLGTIAVNATGGWQTYVDASITGVAISGGNSRVLRLQSVNGGDFNINYVRFTTP